MILGWSLASGLLLPAPVSNADNAKSLWLPVQPSLFETIFIGITERLKSPGSWRAFYVKTHVFQMDSSILTFDWLFSLSGKVNLTSPFHIEAGKFELFDKPPLLSGLKIMPGKITYLAVEKDCPVTACLRVFRQHRDIEQTLAAHLLHLFSQDQLLAAGFRSLYCFQVAIAVFFLSRPLQVLRHGLAGFPANTAGRSAPAFLSEWKRARFTKGCKEPTCDRSSQA